MSLCNAPYRWGGENPLPFGGFDCSGLLRRILLAGGAYPPAHGDLTANQMFNYFKKPENHVSQVPQLGAVVFYGTPGGRVRHCGWMVDSKKMVEACGHEGVVSVEVATDENWYVMVNPIYRRSDLVGIFVPHYLAVDDWEPVLPDIIGAN